MQSHLKIIHFFEKRKLAFGNEACQPFSLYQAEKAIWNPLQTNIFPFKTREGEKREAATTQAGNFIHGLFSSGCHQKNPLFLSQKDHFFFFWGKRKMVGWALLPASCCCRAGLSHGRAWILWSGISSLEPVGFGVSWAQCGASLALGQAHLLYWGSLRTSME